MKNSKYKIIAFALAIAICLSFGANAFAAEPGTMVTQSTDKLEVRVNGHLTQFPDAQPYIDENSRTLIPLRFVTEALGAEVSWNQSAKIASVEKNGIRCDITIGEADMLVTENGNTSTVTMDTQAVLKNSRTFVPIRYVAEALGAYVDYSNYYRTVGIWQSVFTPEQIEYLQSLPINYKMHYTDSYKTFIDEFSGPYTSYRTEDGFESFATAREYVYRNIDTSPVNMQWTGWVPSTEDDSGVLLDKFVTEATLLYMRDEEGKGTSEDVNLYFDSALVYQPNIQSDAFVLRGIAVTPGPYYYVIDVRCGRNANSGGAHCDYYSTDFSDKGLQYFDVTSVPFKANNLPAKAVTTDIQN